MKKLLLSLIALLLIIVPANAVKTGLTGNDSEQFDDYTRHIDVVGSAATVGSTAPTATTIGNSRPLCFDADAEVVYFQFEVGDDWNESSDYELEIVWNAEEGDALADTETVKFDIAYYSVAEGEAIDNGTEATGTVTYTQSGAGTDKELIESDITIDYDGANQPLTAMDTLTFKFDRDMSGDSYGGDACVHRWELKFTANKLPYH
jgi:hypothetical protein